MSLKYGVPNANGKRGVLAALKSTHTGGMVHGRTCDMEDVVLDCNFVRKSKVEKWKRN